MSDNPTATPAAILPSPEFSKNARISSLNDYQTIYEESLENPTSFWEKEAQELTWKTPWTTALEWNAPFAQWFLGGTLNVCENCVDVHVRNGRKNKAAIIWEGEFGEQVTLTYLQLQRRVSQFANALIAQGVQANDPVLIYMPMVPEATIAMLACARIGAVHSVVFGGFSADAIIDRLQDCQAKTIITADGGYRRGSIVPLKSTVDEALQTYKEVNTVFVHQRTNEDISMQKGRDHWLHEALEKESPFHEAQGFDSEHPLFILYTSGSTGKPKGILHSSGGYLTNARATCKYIFDMQDDDVYWCTADVGWITGHTYITYGPLAMGATQIMYEGAPNYPDFGRFWKMIQDYGVTIFYTAPTAIRAFIKAGDQFPDAYDLSSLRLLGTVGEPINPAAWEWYHQKIGGGRCPIVDTWWQTETGAIMISPLPGATPIKPGTCTRPFFGIDAAILNEEGQECSLNEPGKLVIRQPWPSMLRTIFGDPERYKETYWSDYPGYYTVGDGAYKDEDGNIWIVGRLDDVLNVSGHRLGTAEVESALVAHPLVAEAAVVGRPHEIKGEAISAFVTLKQASSSSEEELQKELRNHVGKVIGAIAKPDDVYLVPALPKTRSGKIMRRLLKELVRTGQVTGNVTTLEDPSIIEIIQSKVRTSLS